MKEGRVNEKISWILMVLLLVTVSVLSFASCGKKDDSKDNGDETHQHRFVNYVSDGNATCRKDGTKTAKCTLCEETKTISDSGSGGHKWIEATCTEPKTCSLCNATEGDTVNHLWIDNICSSCGRIKPTEGLKYVLTDEDTAYKVVGIGTATDKVIGIPSEYEGLQVTAISNYAFKNNKDIERIFYRAVCTSLESIVIPNGVTSIGAYAFSGCRSLTIYIN